MGKKTVLICDLCAKEWNEGSAVGWLHVSVVGIDAQTMSDPALPADLCSSKCLREYMELRLLRGGEEGCE